MVGFNWGYSGIMEMKMETTIVCGVWGSARWLNIGAIYTYIYIYNLMTLNPRP